MVLRRQKRRSISGRTVEAIVVEAHCLGPDLPLEIHVGSAAINTHPCSIPVQPFAAKADEWYYPVAGGCREGLRWTAVQCRLPDRAVGSDLVMAHISSMAISRLPDTSWRTGDGNGTAHAPLRVLRVSDLGRDFAPIK